MQDVEVHVAVDVGEVDVQSTGRHVGIGAGRVGGVGGLRARGPDGRVAHGDRLTQQLEVARVELAEVAHAIVQEEARRQLTAEGTAVARVHEVKVTVVVQVTKVAVAAEVDVAAADQHLRGRDRRACATKAHPTGHGLVLVVTGRARLSAAHVGPPLVALLADLRGVRQVDVEVGIVVKVDELDVATVGLHHRELLRGAVDEDAHGAALGEALVDPDLALVVASVAAIGKDRVPVAVEIDVAKVNVLGVPRRGRDVRRVARQLLGLSGGADCHSGDA